MKKTIKVLEQLKKENSSPEVKAELEKVLKLLRYIDGQQV